MIELLGEDDAKLRAAAEDRAAHTFEHRFATFDADNPNIYRLLVRFARQLRDRGYSRCGIALLWERMRWEMMLSTSDPAGFKLNNDYKADYARMMMRNEPDLREFFRVRELRSKHRVGGDAMT